MQKRIWGIALIVLLLVSIVFAVDSKEEEVLYQGTLMQVSGIWFIKTADNMLGLEISEMIAADGSILELAMGDTVTVKGELKETTLTVNELIRSEITYLPKTENETTEEKITGYHVNSAKCIGCRLCVKNCPVGAISMQNGKAVIDVNKCIQCGICANGNGQGFKGCPVGAISKE